MQEGHNNKDLVLRVLVVGDKGIGKTSFIREISNFFKNNKSKKKTKKGHATNDYASIEFRFKKDDPSACQHFRDKKYKLLIYEYDDALGESHYTDKMIDFVIVCFSLGSRQSFDNVKNVWIPKLESHGFKSATNSKSSPYTPQRHSTLLLGLQKDLSESAREIKDSIDTGSDLSRELRIGDYYECSSLVRRDKDEGEQQDHERHVVTVVKIVIFAVMGRCMTCPHH